MLGVQSFEKQSKIHKIFFTQFDLRILFLETCPKEIIGKMQKATKNEDVRINTYSEPLRTCRCSIKGKWFNKSHQHVDILLSLNIIMKTVEIWKKTIKLLCLLGLQMLKNMPVCLLARK